jgi:hypothetical protein
MRISKRGIKAWLNARGTISWIIKDKMQRNNTILNHLNHSLFSITPARHKITKGLSHMMFIFNFICGWSVKKLKKIISKARSEKIEKITISVTFTAVLFLFKA